MDQLSYNKRRTGDTTGKILEALGKCLQNQGIKFSFADQMQESTLDKVVDRVITKLELTDVEVSTNIVNGETIVSILSDKLPIYETTDGKLLKDIT